MTSDKSVYFKTSNSNSAYFRHMEQYEAYSKLGPFCPKCRNLAQAFEIDFNPTRGLYEGKVDCLQKCKKTYRMIYAEREWKFDK